MPGTLKMGTRESRDEEGPCPSGGVWPELRSLDPIEKELERHIGDTPTDCDSGTAGMSTSSGRPGHRGHVHMWGQVCAFWEGCPDVPKL